MGLDIVELLFAAEEKLWVHIHDTDASNLATPRVIADYVYFALASCSLNVRVPITSDSFSV